MRPQQLVFFTGLLLLMSHLALASHQVIRFSLSQPGTTAVLLRVAEARGFDVWASNATWMDIMLPYTALPGVSKMEIPFTVLIENVENSVAAHLKEVKVWSTFTGCTASPLPIPP